MRISGNGHISEQPRGLHHETRLRLVEVKSRCQHLIKRYHGHPHCYAESAPDSILHYSPPSSSYLGPMFFNSVLATILLVFPFDMDTEGWLPNNLSNISLECPQYPWFQPSPPRMRNIKLCHFLRAPVLSPGQQCPRTFPFQEEGHVKWVSSGIYFSHPLAYWEHSKKSHNQITIIRRYYNYFSLSRSRELGNELFQIS